MICKLCGKDLTEAAKRLGEVEIKRMHRDMHERLHLSRIIQDFVNLRDSLSEKTDPYTRGQHDMIDHVIKKLTAPHPIAVFE